MYNFKLVQTDSFSLTQYNDLMKVVFPNARKFSKEFLKWEYEANPCGKIIGFNAFFGESLVAHYVTQPVIIKLNGIENKALLSLNTATHPDHQGKKLFTTLAEMTYNYAFENGYNFIYGIANDNSTYGFVKKLGFQFVAPLITKLGVGSLKHIDNPYDFEFLRVWDEKSFSWRLSNPASNYFVGNNQILAPTEKLFINAILSSIEKDKQPDLKLHLSNNLKKVKTLCWIG
ncbi:MAG: GNAT family N-acetyltransferase [Saprospiraceae bacterium]|nr:GNAT family N-acetyltransferase [Saprospiraceae bacterium]